MRGFFLGALGLIVLEVVVTGTQGGNAVGGALDVIAKGVRMFVDPTIPAFKWKTGTAAAGTAGAQSASYPTVPNPQLPSQIAGQPVVTA